MTRKSFFGGSSGIAAALAAALLLGLGTAGNAVADDKEYYDIRLNVTPDQQFRLNRPEIREAIEGLGFTVVHVDTAFRSVVVETTGDRPQRSQVANALGEIGISAGGIVRTEAPIRGERGS